MSPLRRMGAVAAAGMCLMASAARVDAYPWPKHRQVVVGAAPAPVAYAPAATYAAPTYLSPAPAAAGAAPMIYQAAPAQAPMVLQAAAAPAPAPTTLTLAPAAAAPSVAAAPSGGGTQVYINGQLYTVGTSATGSAPSNRCELSAEDERALIDDLRAYRREELKSVPTSDKRRDLIDQASSMLEDYCDSADESARRVKARSLANRAMSDEETFAAPNLTLPYNLTPAAANGPAMPMVSGQAAMQAPMMAAPAAPLWIQPVMPVLLQPVQSHKCLRCLHRPFCVHGGY